MELRYIVLLYINILFTCVCKGQNDFSPLVGNSEPDIVLVEQSPGNDYEAFPDKYSIWFYYEGEPMYFDLSRDDVMTEALCPSLFRLAKYLPDGLMGDDNEKDFAFYHNNQDVKSDTRAHFVLHRPDPAAPANIYGQINHDGYQYILEASGKSNRHRLRRELSLAAHRSKRDLPVAGVDNIIELVVWTAPDLFKYQKSRLGLTNANTATWMDVYRASLVRDVDLTFKLISDFNIRVTYSAGGDTQKTSEAWWKDNYEDPYLLFENALTDVTAILQAKIGNGLTDYDHAVVLTRADLAKKNDGTGSAKQAVTTGAMCTGDSGSSVSIAEVSSAFFRKVVTQAVGLGFGIDYDSGGNAYTIMAKENPSFPIPSANKLDLWSFSNASIETMETYINALTTNCFQTQDANLNFKQNLKTTQTYGDVYSQDEQCAIVYGSGSTACSGHTLANTTCYEDVKCEVSSTCDQDLLFGDKTTCDSSGNFGCRYSECAYALGTTTTTTSTTSTTTATTTTSTTSTTSSTTSTTSSTTSTTTSTTPTPTTSEGAKQTTTVTEERSSPTMIPSSTPAPDCCCERRPLGQVKINIEYIPCPDGNSENRYILP